MPVTITVWTRVNIALEFSFDGISCDWFHSISFLFDHASCNCFSCGNSIKKLDQLVLSYSLKCLPFRFSAGAQNKRNWTRDWNCSVLAEIKVSALNCGQHKSWTASLCLREKHGIQSLYKPSSILTTKTEAKFKAQVGCWRFLYVGPSTRSASAAYYFVI